MSPDTEIAMAEAAVAVRRALDLAYELHGILLEDHSAPPDPTWIATRILDERARILASKVQVTRTERPSVSFGPAP